MWIKQHLFSSIRWRILLTFLVIIGASFAITAVLLTSLVSSTLYQQRTRQVSLSAQRLAWSAAPFFAEGQLDPLREGLTASANDLGARILLLDADRVVQLDTRAEIEGTSVDCREVSAVLQGSTQRASGIYPDEDKPGEYVAICTARMLHMGQSIGVLLVSTSVTELHETIVTMEKLLVSVFAAVAAVALIAALIFSVTLTKPVKALTSAIRRMGKGDLSARVHTRASGELRELAESYNAMAEQIENFDRSRSQFVSNASHELRTPLTAMKLLLECMIEQPDMPEELRMEFMHDVNHEIDRLSGVISDLLTLTKLDAGGAALQPVDVDLSGLTLDTLHTLKPMADKAGLTITSAVTPGIHVSGDKTKLASIIYNLTDNAIKYTPGGGEVHVSLSAKGKNAVLVVSDNGIGIPQSEQPHVFDRFYRVDKARSRDTGGTGLGLSIVRQMVQLHGGDVTLTSDAGQGAAFTVSLPLKKDDA